jgi:hypothetical protein
MIKDRDIIDHTIEIIDLLITKKLVKTNTLDEKDFSINDKNLRKALILGYKLIKLVTKENIENGFYMYSKIGTMQNHIKLNIKGILFKFK